LGHDNAFPDGVGARFAASVYDVLSSAVRDVPLREDRVAKAHAAAPRVWERALQLEACGPWLDRVRRANPLVAAAVRPVDTVLRAHGQLAVSQGLVAYGQLAELAAVAQRLGVRVLALKGAARLLGGEAPGRRTLSDIDVLPEAGGATALFDALVRECGYTIDSAITPGRHRPMLVRAGGVPVEIHERLTDAGSSVDARIWDGATPVALGGSTLAIPTPTARVMHTLQHGLVVHRTVRYRLRDVTDVKTVWATAGVDHDAVRQWVAKEPYASAAGTLLAAAGVMPYAVRAERAWATVRRVAIARLAVPERIDVRASDDPLVYIAGQLAEGSPAVLAGLAWRALTRPAHAATMVEGFVTRATGRGRNR
jgi:putative nucleotidyltransferase-like protein